MAPKVEAAEVVVNIVTNARAAANETKGFQKSLGDLGKTVAFAVIAKQATDLAVNLVNLASDAEETGNKFRVTFRDIQTQANAVAKNLADNYGLSSRASQQLLADTGDLLSGFGFTQKEALRLSEQVNTLAVDLASFTNFSGGAEGASQALTKGLLGEREALKSLGIAITEADITRLAKEKGIVTELTRQTKAALTLELALSQSANAIGDFERSQDSFAAQSKILTAEVDNLAVELGQQLIPIAKDLVAVAQEVVGWFSDLSDGNKQLLLTLVGLAAAAGPVAIGIGAISTAAGFLVANPLFLAIGAVGALTLAFVGYQSQQEKNLQLLADQQLETLKLVDSENKLAIQNATTARSIDDLVKAGEDADEVLKTNAGFVDDLAGEYPELSRTTLEAALATGTLAEQLRDADIGRARSRLRDLEEDAKKLNDEFKRLTGTRQGFGRAIGEADLGISLGLNRNETKEFEDQLASLLETFARGELQVAGAVGEFETLELGLFGLIDAFTGSEEAADSISGEIAEFTTQTIEGIDALRNLSEGLAENEAAQQIARDTLAGMRSEAAATVPTYQELSDAIGGNTEALAENEAAQARLNDILARRAELNEENAARLFEQTASEIEILERRRDVELALAEEVGANRLLIEQFYAEEIKKIRDSQAEEQKARDQEFLENTLGLVDRLSTAFLDFSSNIQDQELQRIETVNQAEIDALRASGATEAEVTARKEELDEKFAEKKRKSLRDTAIRERNINLALAGINTAAAIAEALPNVPLSLFAGAEGLAQVAVIASTPIPAAQFGGSFQVPPGNPNDSALLRVNEGEDVEVTSARNSGSGRAPERVTLQIGEQEAEGIFIRGVQNALASGEVVAREEIIKGGKL